MGSRVPFAPALLCLRIIVLSATVVLLFLEVKANKAVEESFPNGF